MPLLGFALFSAFGLFILYLWRTHPEAIVGNPLYFEGVFFTGASATLWTFLFLRNRLRPIGADDNHLSTLNYSGSVKASIEWRNIESITRICGFDNVVSRNRYFFEIQGPTCRIYFDDAIEHMDDLLETINRQIKLHRIEAICIDRGTDTLARIRSTESDRVERQRLVRTGVIQSVSVFSASD